VAWNGDIPNKGRNKNRRRGRPGLKFIEDEQILLQEVGGKIKSPPVETAGLRYYVSD